MTNTEKEATVKLGGMQAHTRDLFNKGIGSEGTCSTAGDTAAKEVTLGTTFELVSKATILVKFTNAISVANATLAVTHTDLSGTTTTETAKPIYYRGAALAADLVKADDSLILRYDGTSWNILGVLDQDMTDTYPELTAGNVVGEFSDNNAEFAYRPTAGAVDIESGQADYGGHLETIKGSTIAWNQLVKEPDDTWRGISGTVTVLNKEVTLSPSAAYSSIIGNNCSIIGEHKYYCSCMIKANADITRTFQFGYSSGYMNPQMNNFEVKTTFKKMSAIGTPIRTTPNGLISLVCTTAVTTDMLTFRDIIYIDLTLIYGAGNEPTTPEEFEADYQKWFGKPLSYEEYDEGSLRNVKMTGIKTVGFNQWDGELKNGFIDNGSFIPSPNYRCTKNYVRIIPNIDYFIENPTQQTGNDISIIIILYDRNKNYIGTNIGIHSGNSIIITMPSNACYLMFYFNGVPNNTDVCINLHHSGDRDGQYEPYWESTLNVPVTTLKGKLNGQGSSVVVFPDGMKKAGPVYDEIVRRGDKTYAIKRVGSVDMGTLEWGYVSGFCFSWENSIVSYRTSGTSNAICAKYYSDLANVTRSGMDDKTLRQTGSTISIKDTDYFVGDTSAATFKTAMSGVMLFYELAEPEEYLLDGFELPQDYDVDDYGTEEILLGTNGCAPILDLKYGINAGDTIKNLPHRYVSAVGEQNFTEAQKERARVNIGLDNLSRLGSGFGICSTDATVAAKEVTIPHFLLLTNGTVSVRFTKAVSVNDATLNVSGTGAKPILINDYPLPAGVIKARTTATLCYDGTNWNITAIMDYEQGAGPSDLYVDMKLPSGILWAKSNIDVTQPNGFAASPFQYECSFFSWGNTDGHNPTSNNSFSPYSWGDGNDEEPYVSSPGAQLTGNIGPSYDAARVHCGMPWRMPTKDEFVELFANIDYVQADGETVIDASQSNKIITIDGINGIYIKSKINGNLLFFACSGYGVKSLWNNPGSEGDYWSSTIHNTANAYFLSFLTTTVGPSAAYVKFRGYPIRPVQ